MENPTVDEVVHLPAGVTYWQKGTFRLYHHNPPLVRMVAALPVICLGNPVTGPAYEQDSWTIARSFTVDFLSDFCLLSNADRYFDLFRLARMVMPLFSMLGGLVVFDWSRRLYGNRGGLLSLCLWVFCPNILAHCRLITTDVGSTALGVAATFVFWLYLRSPSWPKAMAAGVMLGLAELTKFSMLLALCRLAVALARPADPGGAADPDCTPCRDGRCPRICSRGDKRPGDRCRVSFRRRRHSPGSVRVRLRNTDKARRRGHSQGTGQPEPALCPHVAVSGESVSGHDRGQATGAIARALPARLR